MGNMNNCYIVLTNKIISTLELCLNVPYSSEQTYKPNNTLAKMLYEDYQCENDHKVTSVNRAKENQLIC